MGKWGKVRNSKIWVSRERKELFRWSKKYFSELFKGWYTCDVHENYPIFKTLLPPCPSTSKILAPPWPWTYNFKQTPPLQMITNQLKGSIIQGYVISYIVICYRGYLICYMLYVISFYLQVDFHFQYQVINFVKPFCDFF